MRNRKQQVTEDNLTTSKQTKPTKRSSSYGGKINYFDRIPAHVVVNILSKLPIKHIAKCRCISKLWSSIIRVPNYNLLFPITYPDTPRLLFSFENSGDLLFYSSPQPQNPDEKSSLVATHYDHKNFVSEFYKVCRPVLGFVCRQDFRWKYTSVVVSNPITGESITLPKLTGFNRMTRKEKFSFGYDPIDKQFKVFHITWSFHLGNSFALYQVFTLGTGEGNLFWRKIQCGAIHYPLHENENDNGICINGILYYPAIFLDNEKLTIVCFDVGSEKFSFTNIDQDMATKILAGATTFSLIDYNGKLSACNCDIEHALFELWVLEDAEKHIWSKHSYQMPHTSLHPTSFVRIAGMTGSGEIVLYRCYTRPPFFIFYYNLERNIITTVKVEVPLYKLFRVYTFPNYLENVRLM